MTKLQLSLGLQKSAMNVTEEKVKSQPCNDFNWRGCASEGMKPIGALIDCYAPGLGQGGPFPQPSYAAAGRDLLRLFDQRFRSQNRPARTLEMLLLGHEVNIYLCMPALSDCLSTRDIQRLLEEL